MDSFLYFYALETHLLVKGGENMYILIGFIDYIIVGIAVGYLWKNYFKRVNFNKIVEDFQINKYNHFDSEKDVEIIFGISNGLDLSDQVLDNKILKGIYIIIALILWPIFTILSTIAMKLFEKYSK